LEVLFCQLCQRVAYKTAVELGLGVTTLPGAEEARYDMMHFVEELLSRIEAGPDEQTDSSET
jgi:hypothetical protein